MTKMRMDENVPDFVPIGYKIVMMEQRVMKMEIDYEVRFESFGGFIFLHLQGNGTDGKWWRGA